MGFLQTTCLIRANSMHILQDLCIVHCNPSANSRGDRIHRAPLIVPKKGTPSTLCHRVLFARLHACVGNARLRRTCTRRDRGAPISSTCRAPRMRVLRSHRCGVAMHALRAPTSLRTWVIRPVAHGAIRIRRARNGGAGCVWVVVAAAVVARRWKNRTHRGARTHDHKAKGFALYRMS